jgi:membrane associated rhomboid family serine protease
MVAYHLKHDDKAVEVDGCMVCRGLWLDARESEVLAAITTNVHHETAMPGASKGTVGVVAMYLLQVATLLPSEVHAPLKRKALLIPIAVVLMTFIFGYEMFLAASDKADAFVMTYGLVPADFARGRNAFSLVTHTLLHGSVMHLLGNMYTLWIFGDNIEDILGRGRAALLYWASGIAGGLLYFVLNMKGTGPLVGASGAISGLMGAYLVLLPRVKLWLVIFFVPVKIRAYWYMIVWLGLQFVLMYDTKSNIAWQAHLGGFIVGVALAFALRPKVAVDVPPSMRVAR